ncbi:RTA1 domain-containing protein [Sporobolomyces koalae]|uniref:RTA1 domain-containing protein n=1 Tax=Sporobolomyces koalae TaxID=500713 RepID=UPI00317C99A2
MPSLPSRLLVLAVTAVLVGAQSTEDSEARRPVAGYEPKIYLSVIGLILYALSGGLHWIHWHRNKDNRYMLTLSIGMTCMCLGFILRLAYRNALYSVGVYAIMTLFLLLSPCAFLATNYVLLTRLARSLQAEDALFIRASWVVKIFVWADVVTFLLQGAGGGLSSSPSSADLGHKISLVGLALQLVSYGLFCALLIVFRIRARPQLPGVRTHLSRQDSWNTFSTSPLGRWHVLWTMLVLSSIAIIIRSVFRLVEYSQGYSGYIPTHEGYFYLLDALPLWLGMTLYSIVWPSRFFQSTDPDLRFESSSTGGTSKTEPVYGMVHMHSTAQ